MNKKFRIVLEWWHLLLIIAVPIVINILASIPSSLSVGGGEIWIGFFGNYAGGLVGAFLAIIIANTQTRLVLHQIDQEKKEKDVEESRRREIGLSVVRHFLYEEMKNNLERIDPNVFKGLEEKVTSQPSCTYVINNSFEYNVYNDTKYDLLKYQDDEVLKIIEFYQALKLLEKYTFIEIQSTAQSIPVEAATFLHRILKKWRDRFEAELF